MKNRLHKMWEKLMLNSIYIVYGSPTASNTFPVYDESMSLRIAKEGKKQLKIVQEVMDSYDAKVIASKHQLFESGIDDDLTNKVVKVIKNYDDGYVQIVGTPHPHVIDDQLWDIPMRYLEKL